MSKLHVLWTTEEREVAIKVVFPYLFFGKANGWWDEMNLVIWGPSARLVGNDPEVQQLLQDVLDSGITVEACKVCTDAYGVTDFMLQKDVNVRYVGAFLTEYVKTGEKIITF